MHLKTLYRFYNTVIMAFAGIAGTILAVVSVFIIYDVVLRNMYISPPAWTFPSIEYGLLYATMLAAPWLVRTRGHVMIEVVHQQLPPRFQRRLEKLVYVICIAICAVLSVFLVDLLVKAYQSGEVDVRAIDIPHTFIYWPMLIGFILMGCEFLRFLVGKDSLYHRSTIRPEGVE